MTKSEYTQELKRIFIEILNRIPDGAEVDGDVKVNLRIKRNKDTKPAEPGDTDF